MDKCRARREYSEMRNLRRVIQERGVKEALRLYPENKKKITKLFNALRW